MRLFCALVLILIFASFAGVSAAPVAEGCIGLEDYDTYHWDKLPGESPTDWHARVEREGVMVTSPDGSHWFETSPGVVNVVQECAVQDGKLVVISTRRFQLHDCDRDPPLSEKDLLQLLSLPWWERPLDR